MAYNSRSRSEDKQMESKTSRVSNIQESVVYYEKILQSLQKEINTESKDIFAYNTLQESEGKEVELSCHGISSHCLELLLTECKDISVMQRFMSAFAENKVPVCTSANASHITEILIHYAVKHIQNWALIMDQTEDSEEKVVVSFCINWLSDFGNFVLENFDDCLGNLYSCHVVTTLIRAFAGDLSQEAKFMSKNSKVHKQEFRSKYIESNLSAAHQSQSFVVLDQIPKFFSKALKKLYKSLIKSEYILDYVMNSSSATVIEALLFALKKRSPKSCKKMIMKIAEILFTEKNQNGIPVSLLHKNCSFIVDEMLKAADENLQLTIWTQYIADHLEKLVTHSVGNYIIQRLFDVITDKATFGDVCESIWPVFEEILKSRNYGIFVSMATACNRLSAQQAPFMKNLMLCMGCYEPEDHQDLIMPLLLGFQKYDSYIATKDSTETNLVISLQGSLVAQAVLKFHKPIKAVQSILRMQPADLDILAGHTQGCHVLNAFFGSVSVGEKNKEKLLHHLKPVIISIASDREKSLTLCRIWMLLSIKLKEIVARELAQNKDTVRQSKWGKSVLEKFGIHHFKRYQDWKEIQSNISCKKKKI